MLVYGWSKKIRNILPTTTKIGNGLYYAQKVLNKGLRAGARVSILLVLKRKRFFSLTYVCRSIQVHLRVA